MSRVMFRVVTTASHLLSGSSGSWSSVSDKSSVVASVANATTSVGCIVVNMPHLSRPPFLTQNQFLVETKEIQELGHVRHRTFRGAK